MQQVPLGPGPIMINSMMRPAMVHQFPIPEQQPQPQQTQPQQPINGNLILILLDKNSNHF